MNLAEMSALSFRAAEAGPDVKVMPSNGGVPTLAEATCTLDDGLVMR